MNYCTKYPTNEPQKITLKVLVSDAIAILGTEPARAAGWWVFIAEQRLRHVGGRTHVPAVHTEALAGRGETCRWMLAAAGPSGNRILAIV